LKPPREPDGWGNRRRVILPIPDQNLLLMESYINPTTRVPGIDREQQIWTYRYADGKTEGSPQPPAAVHVTTARASALVQWQLSPSREVTGYVGYRGEGAKPWLVDYKPVGRVERSQPSFRDTGLKSGTVYYYCVRAAAKDGTESADSRKVRTQPRVVEEAV